ncbi:MAG: chemotaxis protein [Sulfuricella sp.]|nr:chemotaxis protein [Sulfuricella sp.]
MSKLLKDVDARTRLAGTNRLEILLFMLGADQRTGRRAFFGINVFKVREVMRRPEIVAAPQMPEAVEGMISLRGRLVPVIDLVKYASIEAAEPPGILIVTEYNNHTQGLLVGAVDNILRLDWAAFQAPPEMLRTQMSGLVTAVTELQDGRLVMMLDVEKVLAEIGQHDDAAVLQDIKPLAGEKRMVFFADDSLVARRQIERTLDAMKLRHKSGSNGKEAWHELRRIADEAEASRTPLRNILGVVLTDVEMPEMDGYMLTRLIKGDSRFAGIPVIMHSSLSGASNRELGASVGVDAYVPKFDPQRLAGTLERLLGSGVEHQESGNSGAVEATPHLIPDS